MGRGRAKEVASDEWRVARKRAGLKPGHYKRAGEEPQQRKERGAGDRRQSSHEKIKIRALKTVGCGTRPWRSETFRVRETSRLSPGTRR